MNAVGDRLVQGALLPDGADVLFGALAAVLVEGDGGFVEGGRGLEGSDAEHVLEGLGHDLGERERHTKVIQSTHCEKEKCLNPVFHAPIKNNY